MDWIEVHLRRVPKSICNKGKVVGKANKKEIVKSQGNQVAQAVFPTNVPSDSSGWPEKVFVSLDGMCGLPRREILLLFQLALMYLFILPKVECKDPQSNHVVNPFLDVRHIICWKVNIKSIPKEDYFSLWWISPKKWAVTKTISLYRTVLILYILRRRCSCSFERRDRRNWEEGNGNGYWSG